MHITSLGLWLYKILSQKTGKGGSWRDDSAVKSIYCSSRGPGFSFQDPHMEIHILLELQLQGSDCCLLTSFGTRHVLNYIQATFIHVK